MSPETIDRVIGKFGTQADAAAVVGLSQTAIAMWKKRRQIPSNHIATMLAAARDRGIDLTPADFFDPPPGPATTTAAPAEAA